MRFGWWRMLAVLALCVAATGSEAAQGGPIQSGSQVAVAARNRTAFEFVARAEQVGPNLTFYGYVTQAAGLTPSQLFTKPSSGESTVRLVFSMQAKIVGRSVLGKLFVIDAQGTGDFHFLPSGGASFARPASFAAGRSIGTVSLGYQSILTVVAPNQGLVTGLGELRESQAGAFTLGGRQYRFGRPGLALRLVVSGPGVRTNATLPKAQLDIAGTAVGV